MSRDKPSLDIFLMHDFVPWTDYYYSENWQNSRLIVEIWILLVADTNKCTTFCSNTLLLCRKSAKIVTNYKYLKFFRSWYFLNNNFSSKYVIIFWKSAKFAIFCYWMSNQTFLVADTFKCAIFSTTHTLLFCRKSALYVIIYFLVWNVNISQKKNPQNSWFSATKSRHFRLTASNS